MKANIEIIIPATPTHLSLPGGAQIHICSLTEKELRQIGKEWTDLLVKRASEGSSAR